MTDSNPDPPLDGSPISPDDLRQRHDPSEAEKQGRIRTQGQKQRLQMQAAWNRTLRVALVAQILAVHLAFFLLFFVRPETLDYRVIVGYFGAALVETVGLVAVVVRHLFPPGDGK